MISMGEDDLFAFVAMVAAVARAHDGSIGETCTWFDTRHPLLGNISPIELIATRGIDHLVSWAVHTLIEHRRYAPASNKLPVDHLPEGSM